MQCYHMALCISSAAVEKNIGLICDRIVWLWYFGLIALVMYPGSETALGFASRYFTPLLDALLMLSQTPHQPSHYIYI